jgi:hypothetical protein
VVALYLARPVAGPARSYLLPWNGSAYQYLVEDAWVKIWQGGTICCEFDHETRTCYQHDAATTWQGTRFFRTLTSGVDSLSGSFQLLTNGIYGGESIGEANPVAGVLTVTRTIRH